MTGCVWAQGTVLTVDQVELACRLGAGYISIANSNDAVIKRTKELDMVSIPGAMTPTEIVHARDCGADIVKPVYSRRYKPCEVPYGTIGAYPHAGYLQCKS